MMSETSADYEKYYVPESSKLAVCATIGLVLSIFGAASIMNDMTFGDAEASTNSWKTKRQKNIDEDLKGICPQIFRGFLQILIDTRHHSIERKDHKW